LADKEANQIKLNTVIERAEQLYPNTNSEGREAVRTQVKQLRDQWDQYSETLLRNSRMIEQTLKNWESFNLQFKELDDWLKQSAAKASVHGPNDSLQDKKDRRQKLKV
jgi:nesprin-1